MSSKKEREERLRQARENGAALREQRGKADEVAAPVLAKVERVFDQVDKELSEEESIEPKEKK